MDDSHRIWRSYETDGDRYVAFKDQMYGTSGALVASGVEGGKTEAADTVEYRHLRKPGRRAGSGNRMEKIDQALPESSGTGQASEDMENEGFYKTLFYTWKNCRIKKSIFNFVYVKTEQTAKL